MKNLLLPILLIIPFLGLTQINRSIDLINGIDFSYRSITSSSNNELVYTIIDGRNERELPKFNSRLGVNYNQRISKSLFLKTGISLTSFGYKNKKMTDLNFPIEIDEMGNPIENNDLPTESQLFYNYIFTEFPFALRFEINRKKLTPFVEAGISPAVFITSQSINKTDIGRTMEFSQGVPTPFNRFHLFGHFSIGLNYSNNDDYQLYVQPTFRYQLYYSDLKDAPIKERLFNTGIEIGIRKRLN